MDECSAANQARQTHREQMHDLRTPLTVLLGRVQMLRRSHAAGRRLGEVESDLEVIEAAVLRLAAAIEVLDAQTPRDS